MCGSPTDIWVSGRQAFLEISNQFTSLTLKSNVKLLGFRPVIRGSRIAGRKSDFVKCYIFRFLKRPLTRQSIRTATKAGAYIFKSQNVQPIVSSEASAKLAALKLALIQIVGLAHGEWSVGVNVIDT